MRTGLLPTNFIMRSVVKNGTNGCAVCVAGGRHNKGVNDLWTTYPQVAKHLVDPRLVMG